MSRLLDNTEINLLPKTATPKQALFSLGADLEKYAIMEERGQGGSKARNLHKLDLKGSIYDKD